MSNNNDRLIERGEEGEGKRKKFRETLEEIYGLSNSQQWRVPTSGLLNSWKFCLNSSTMVCIFFQFCKLVCASVFPVISVLMNEQYL